MADRRLAAGLAGVLAMMSAPAEAADKVVFAKVGAHAADVGRDAAECRTLAAKTFYQQDNPGPAYGGVVGAAMLATMTPGLNAQAQEESLAICMRHHGYGAVSLTAAEASGLAALKSEDARAAWLEAFLAGDIASRVQVALTPAAPPLPSAQDAHDLFVIGAALIDPGALVLARGPVSKGGDVLNGKLRRRAVAVLQQDFSARSGMLSFHTAAGAVFQEYLAPDPWEPILSEDRTAWCTVFKGGFDAPMCFRSTLQGYEVAAARGEAWLVTHVDAEPALRTPYRNSVTLVVQPEDSQGPLDWRLIVSALGDETVELTARAERDERSVSFWSGALKFGPDGAARLPFWDRTLVLRRTGDALSATFEPRSDGKGWLSDRVGSGHASLAHP